MLRSIAFGLAIAAIALPAYALDMSGDYDCVADVPETDTPAGTMRIGPDNTYGFLTSDATVDDWHRLKYGADNSVRFDSAFAEQIAKGATLVEAAVQPEESSFTAKLTMANGKPVTVYCPFIP